MEALTETTQDRATGALITVPRSVFDTVPELAPEKLRWRTRCAHYEILRSYYRGTVYVDHPELRSYLKLYSGIRQIFGPLRRVVRFDVAKVPGGFPVAADVPADVSDAIDQIRTWSRARLAYPSAVLHGAVAGEFGLYVSASDDGARIIVGALRPDEVVTGRLDDGTPFGLIVKPGLADREGRYEYAQYITPAFIREYRSGKLTDERPNAAGIVPILLSPYRVGEDGIGEPAFAGAQELLDRVNDITSQVIDVIQRNAEPITVMSGVTEVDWSAENNTLALPSPDSKAYTLEPNLAVAEALEVIREVKSEFKSVLPQLVWDNLLSRNDLAYETVITLLDEFIGYVTDVRGYVDTAIEEAERMALTMGNVIGLWSVDPTMHRIEPDRPVFQRVSDDRGTNDMQDQGDEPQPVNQ